MNVKTAAGVLLAGSILWLLQNIYWMIESFSGEAWKYYYKEKPIRLIMTNALVLVPITMIIFAVALMNRRSR